LRARENETPRYFAKLIGATLEDVLGAMKMSDNLRFKKGTKVYLPTAAAVDYKRRADEAQAVAKAKAVEAAAVEAAAAEAAAAEAALNVEDEPLTVEYANGEQGQVFADRAATAKAAQAAAAQAAAPEVAKEAEEAGRGEEDVSGSGAADGMSLASVVQRLQDAVAALQAEQE